MLGNDQTTTKINEQFYNNSLRRTETVTNIKTVNLLE